MWARGRKVRGQPRFRLGTQQIGGNGIQEPTLDRQPPIINNLPAIGAPVCKLRWSVPRQHPLADNGTLRLQARGNKHRHWIEKPAAARALPRHVYRCQSPFVGLLALPICSYTKPSFLELSRAVNTVGFREMPTVMQSACAVNWIVRHGGPLCQLVHWPGSSRILQGLGRDRLMSPHAHGRGRGFVLLWSLSIQCSS